MLFGSGQPGGNPLAIMVHYTTIAWGVKIEMLGSICLRRTINISWYWITGFISISEISKIRQVIGRKSPKL